MLQPKNILAGLPCICMQNMLFVRLSVWRIFISLIYCYVVTDTSLFGWGLGVGMMCMMSAGKAEFNRLNTAVSETTKVVQELKLEIHERKSSRDLRVLGCVNDASFYHEYDTTICKDSQHNLSESIATKIGSNENKSSSPLLINDVECASSVLTEEPAPGMQEMDQLEAELEFELQKLPWCAMEVSTQEDIRDLREVSLLALSYDFLIH